MDSVLTKIGEYKLVPVIKIARLDDALPLGEALLQGGMPLVEITFRTKAAAEVINALSQELPEMLVGAGTVLTVEQVDLAVEAGARFIVAPGFNPRIVDFCLQRGVPVIPGVNSPTQIEMGLERGLTVLKFFPAEASGGIKFLRAIAGPYDGVMFMPTGGITVDNLATYLEFDRVIACGGTWFVKDKLIDAGNFEEISRLTRQALDVIAAM
jgi:2-dehydro-3-deoxyphosphogluconate aldolase/(4S)-4-hydroxy-2-oxoglutarate aldolase